MSYLALIVALVAALPSSALAWVFLNNKDDMGRGDIKIAMVPSTNRFQLAFPYQGSQRATLMLRSGPGLDIAVMLTVERGQFLCRVDTCDIAIKFDDEEAKSATATRPNDGSSDLIFLGDEYGFIEAAKKAKRVKIEATFYQNGARVFDFPVSGLGGWPENPPKPTPKSPKK